MAQPVPVKRASWHLAVGHLHLQHQVVAAERVEPLGRGGRPLQRPEVPRALAVVEDDLLVEIGELAQASRMDGALTRRP